MREYIVPIYDDSPNYDEIFVGYIRENATEVVRCKDCRWHENEQPSMVYCPAVVGGWVDNDWFCKGGERRDDETD